MTTFNKLCRYIIAFICCLLQAAICLVLLPVALVCDGLESMANKADAICDNLLDQIKRM